MAPLTKTLSDALAGRDLRTAILSDSIVVRGAVTALAWLGISLRAFPLDDHAALAEYLEIPSDEIKRAIEQLRVLRKECGVDEVRFAA